MIRSVLEISRSAPGKPSKRGRTLQRRLSAVCALATALVLTACAEGRGGPIPYNVALPAPDAPTVVPLETGYRIAPLDKVEIKVLKVADLSGDYIGTID